MRALNALLVVLGLLAAGCGDQEQTIPPGTKSTRTTIRMGASFEGNLFDSAGYQFALPKSWAHADLTAENLEKDLKEAWKEKPEMLALVPDVLALAARDQIKFVAFRGDEKPQKFVDNLNVVTEKLPKEMTAKEVTEANLKPLRQMAKGEPESELVEVAGRPAGLIKWQADNGETSLSYFTYVLVKGTNSTVFTFTSDATRAEDMERFARRIMRGLKESP